MKSAKFLIAGILLLLMGLTDLDAQNAPSAGIGLALKASTNGLGGDVIYNFSEKMGLRLGFEKLGFKTNFMFEEETVNYDTDVKFKTGSVSLLFDYYVAKHVFFSAGAGWNLFQTTFAGVAASAFQFGDIQVPREKVGSFNFQVDPSWKVSPYLGVGFGRALGLEKRVGFAFELGGFYQGSPDITILSTGLLSPTSNPDQQQDLRLEKQVSQYSIYPVLKFSLSYKIISL